jgi:hypothetical protein
MRRISLVFAVCALAGGTAWAQQPATTVPIAPVAFPSMEPQTPPPGQGRGTTPPAQPTAAPPANAQGRGTTPPATTQANWERNAATNIRIELTITETGTGSPTKKSVVLTTSGMNRGSIRSTSHRVGMAEMIINVDAKPQVTLSGKISLELQFMYSPDASADPAATRPADLMEGMTVVVEDGKTLMVSQSADPKGDRKVTVEVTATILK